MKMALSRFDFIEEMKKDIYNPFSNEGLDVLFEYLEDYEHATGQELEFDSVAFRSDFSEGTPQEIADNYFIEIDGLSEAEAFDKVVEFLWYHSILIGITKIGTIIYKDIEV
jgi:hypothetical protein